METNRLKKMKKEIDYKWTEEDEKWLEEEAERDRKEEEHI